MLNIYQEFVRNHQYSLQVLANCKQNRDFDKLLKQYEANPACEGRMLETFLTYPMFQVSHPGCAISHWFQLGVTDAQCDQHEMCKCAPWECDTSSVILSLTLR